MHKESIPAVRICNEHLRNQYRLSAQIIPSEHKKTGTNARFRLRTFAPGYGNLRASPFFQHRQYDSDAFDIPIGLLVTFE